MKTLAPFLFGMFFICLFTGFMWSFYQEADCSPAQYKQAVEWANQYEDVKINLKQYVSDDILEVYEYQKLKYLAETHVKMQYLKELK